MKHVRDLVNDYVDEHPEEFERGEVGVLVPDGTDEVVLRKWLDDEGGVIRWAASLRGASKEDAARYAAAALKFLGSKATNESLGRIAWCVDAFADWEEDWTRGPEVVLKACEWMKSELQRRWEEPMILWPWAAVHLLFCELSILAFHRLDTKQSEATLASLLLNSACFFELPKREAYGVEHPIAGTDRGWSLN